MVTRMWPCRRRMLSGSMTQHPGRAGCGSAPDRTATSSRRTPAATANACLGSWTGIWEPVLSAFDDPAGIGAEVIVKALADWILGISEQLDGEHPRRIRAGLVNERGQVRAAWPRPRSRA